MKKINIDKKKALKIGGFVVSIAGMAISAAVETMETKDMKAEITKEIMEKLKESKS